MAGRDENRTPKLELPGSALHVGFAGRIDSWTATDQDGFGFEIGRDLSCFVQMADMTVSRHHARVLPRRTAHGYEWGVEDNSSYGTWIERGTTRLTKGVVHWFNTGVELRLADPKKGPVITLSIGGDQTVRPRPAPEFTAAEMEVLAGLRASMSNREMADALGVGEEAIVKRLGRLRKKLGPNWFDGEDPRRGHLAELAAQMGIEKLRVPR